MGVPRGDQSSQGVGNSLWGWATTGDSLDLGGRRETWEGPSGSWGEHDGAVLRETGGNRLCSAWPPGPFLTQIYTQELNSQKCGLTVFGRPDKLHLMWQGP